jgi:hypothetical protein
MIPQIIWLARVGYLKSLPHRLSSKLHLPIWQNSILGDVPPFVHDVIAILNARFLTGPSAGTSSMDFPLPPAERVLLAAMLYIPKETEPGMITVARLTV